MTAFVQIESRLYPPRGRNRRSRATNDDDSAVEDDDVRAGSVGSNAAHAVADDEEDDSADLPDRLMIELTAYRSLALRDAIANDHAMPISLFCTR